MYKMNGLCFEKDKVLLEVGGSRQVTWTLPKACHAEGATECSLGSKGPPRLAGARLGTVMLL